MFDDASLKIRLYLWTALFFLAGAVSASFGWDWLGLIFWIVGGLIALQIIVVSLIRERASYIESEARKFRDMTKFYETMKSLDPEMRYLMGFGYTPKEITVKKDKTAEVDNEFSQTWKKLPIAPYKLKVIAQATLNGEGFTVRKWAGEDRLLSRAEWDALHEEMVKLGMLESINPDVPTQGFLWTSFGEDVMRQVVRDTL